MPSYHLCARVNWWIYNCERNGDAVCTYAENFEDMEVGVLNFRLSGSFSNEGQSSLLYSRHIKGVLKLASMLIWVVTMSWNMYPSLFLKWLIFNAIATTYVFRNTVHHSYISTSFVETLLLPLFLYILRRPSHMWNEHMYNMTVSDVMEAHAKVLNWMGTLLSNHVARANYNERFSPQGSLSVTKPFWDWLRRVRSKCLTAKSPKLIPIVVSMQP